MYFQNIELDKFIIIPNHIHGIIIINNPVGTAPTEEGCAAGIALSSNRNTKNNNLSIAIGSFKSASAKQINQLNDISCLPTGQAGKWQRSFHDHIIRTTNSLKNIHEYVMNDPTTWDTDEHNIINYSIEDRAVPAAHSVSAGAVPTGLV